MLSQNTVANLPHQTDKAHEVSDEVKDRAFVSYYNESDYSDFLYLAPPLSAQFLPLESEASKNTSSAAIGIKKSQLRPSETSNTGTTPPPVTPAEGLQQQKEYFEATYLPSRQRTPMPEAAQPATAAELERERRPSFVEVTPVKVHHDEHGLKHHKEKRHSHSSQDSEPMNWWPEDETSAQHKWVERGAEDEEEVWSDAFYE